MLQEILHNKITIIALYALLLFIIMRVLHHIMTYLGSHINIYTRLTLRERERIERDLRLTELYGNHKKDIISVFDTKFKAAGIIKYNSAINTEMILIVSLFLNIGIIVLGAIIDKKHITLWALLILVKFLIEYIILEVVIKLRKYAIEKQLLVMMNGISAYSMTNDELILIFEKSIRNVKGRLHTIMADCIKQARITGDMPGALNNAIRQVDSYQFKMLLQSLGTVSRYSNNFSDVINNHIDLYKDYITYREKIKTLRIETIIESTIVACIGIAGVLLIANSMHTLGNTAFTIAVGTIVGCALITYAILISK